ncbi:hypothetical protein E2562_015118 [Oryza meyeriana var. granulata]|uniref:Plant heme peroxidase family profile domain-containing protein n=1 Tax=Oryza meyeriana var. granulata TaxID=110450 RepID=A0A6G1DVS3_9ORYZ|nr:hypothetical protein E2562_015118 [Oryza meyeriana var. granulata]
MKPAANSIYTSSCVACARSADILRSPWWTGLGPCEYVGVPPEHLDNCLFDLWRKPVPDLELALGVGWVLYDGVRSAINLRPRGVLFSGGHLAAWLFLGHGIHHFSPKRVASTASSPPPRPRRRSRTPPSPNSSSSTTSPARTSTSRSSSSVILSGVHSVGDGHCSSFTGRLTALPDQITPAYRGLLNYKCSQRADPEVVNNARDEDLATVSRFMPEFIGRVRPVSVLDNTYYLNNLDKGHKMLGHVHEYADNGTLWDHDFADSLRKLSMLPMPAGSKGEIRNKCSVINHS